jgi:hypothetical protein
LIAPVAAIGLGLFRLWSFLLRNPRYVNKVEVLFEILPASPDDGRKTGQNGEQVADNRSPYGNFDLVEAMISHVPEGEDPSPAAGTTRSET